jgi:hypothetical protein
MPILTFSITPALLLFAGVMLKVKIGINTLFLSFASLQFNLSLIENLKKN